MLICHKSNEKFLSKISLNSFSLRTLDSPYFLNNFNHLTECKFLISPLNTITNQYIILTLLFYHSYHNLL